MANRFKECTTPRFEWRIGIGTRLLSDVTNTLYEITDANWFVKDGVAEFRYYVNNGQWLTSKQIRERFFIKI